MNLKGKTLKVKGKQCILKEKLSEGGFSMIYSTNLPEFVCKVQVLQSPQIAQAYQQEKNMLSNLKHPNIIALHHSVEQELDGNKCGLLILENCSRGTAYNILQKHEGGAVPEKTVINIFIAVASALEYLHTKKVAHRDIKLENVLINDKGQYKLCDFGSASREVISNISKENRAAIEQFIEKTTTPFYRAPEQLDLYSGQKIGPKVDVFAMGVLAFMLAFQKRPFESRLSAINKQYFIPEDKSYSHELIAIIESCFTTKQATRPTAIQIKNQLIQLGKKKTVQIQLNYESQLYKTRQQMARIKQNSLKNQVGASNSFFSTVIKYFNMMTTDTEGWISGFAQDNQEAPQLKYNRSILAKCWEKRYKVDKFYEILERKAQENKQKCLVTLKLLILLHNFLRKGPQEAIVNGDQPSALKLCIKIYKHWKMIKTASQEDPKRNAFICILIKYYCLVIIQKVKVCFENSDLIEGNFSIVPYLRNKESTKLLKFSLVQNLLSFMQICLDFHSNVQKHSYVVEIQRSILLSIVDEEYCLMSTFCFIYSGFKMAIQHFKDELDYGQLQVKITDLDFQFEEAFKQMSKLFQQAQMLATLFEDNKIVLQSEVLQYIKSIDITQRKQGEFIIPNHFNYKKTIYGLKIPITYEDAVNNPNFLKNLEKGRQKDKHALQISQYKVHNGQMHNKSAFVEKNSEKTQPFGQFKFKEIKTPTEHNKMRAENTIMQFSHQNLNRDFMSHNKKEERDNQFKQFLTIANQHSEIQKDKQKEQNQRKVNRQKRKEHRQKSKKVIQSQVGINGTANLIDTEKEESSKKHQNAISNEQLINFFGDSDDSSPLNEKKQKRQQQFVESDKKQKRQQQFVESDKKQSKLQEQKKCRTIKLSFRKEKTDQNGMEKKQQVVHSDKKLVEIASSQEASSKHQEIDEKAKSKSNGKFNIEKIQKKENSQQSCIDLRGFIVDEVKKTAQQYLIDIRNLQFKEKVGYGHSSEVYRGQLRGQKVAIKKIKNDVKSNNQKEFRREIMTTVRIRYHPHLVMLIGVARDDKYLYIINQFCGGQNLFDLLHQSNVPLSWKTRINFAMQIAKGMLFLHTNNPPIIHRDLKSLNVLLCQEYDHRSTEHVQIKIADFGLSRDYASNYMTGALGTYHWMAPQIFNNQNYTLKADVFSFGIVLWQIAARHPPYLDKKNPHALMKFVTIENGRPDLQLIDRDCPLKLKELMIRCWDKLQSNRPNFSEILSILQNMMNDNQ